MMNIEQITTRLAKLPDQALQQYAAMHKNDPYIIALAVSESNRRKQMRQAAQGAQGEMEPPTVVDQDIAEMAPAAPQQMMPEDTGIAQLPVGEMEFAGGGIVAFADGGDVERYQVGGATSALRAFLQATGQTAAYVNGTPAEKAAIEAAFRATVQGPMPVATAPATAPSPTAARVLPSPGALGSAARVAPIAGIPIGIAAGLTSAMEDMRAQGYPVDPAGEFSTGAMTPEQAAFDAARVQRVKEARGMTPQRTETPGARVGLNEERARNMAVVNQEGFTRPAMVNDPRMPAGALADITTQQQVLAGAGAGSGAPTRPAAPAAMPGGIGDINAMFRKALESQKYEDPAKADVAALGRTLEGGAQRRLEEFDKYAKETGDVFKGRDARIAAREAELGKQKETNTGLSLLNAGLAIMSTPGGLATAIGKGARVGTEQFAAGLDKIRAAQDRLEEAKDKVEELRLNRADMTAKERRALTADIDKARADVLRMSIDGTRMAAGVTEKRAAEIVGNQVKVGIAQLEQSGANARAAATVGAANNAPDRQYFAALVQKHKGDTVKAYEEFVTTRQEAKTDASLVAQYAKDPMALKLLETTDPAMAAMIKARIQQSMVPQAQTAPTGAVRD